MNQPRVPAPAPVEDNAAESPSAIVGTGPDAPEAHPTDNPTLHIDTSSGDPRPNFVFNGEPLNFEGSHAAVFVDLVCSIEGDDKRSVAYALIERGFTPLLVRRMMEDGLMDLVATVKGGLNALHGLSANVIKTAREEFERRVQGFFAQRRNVIQRVLLNEENPLEAGGDLALLLGDTHEMITSDAIKGLAVIDSLAKRIKGLLQRIGENVIVHLKDRFPDSNIRNITDPKGGNDFRVKIAFNGVDGNELKDAGTAYLKEMGLPSDYQYSFRINSDTPCVMSVIIRDRNFR